MVALPQVSINTNRNGLCFGCGQSSSIGLKLAFERDGGIVRGQFTCGEQYQGWPGIVHGGIIACILDEAMSHAAHLDGKNCITAKMEVRFKQPVPVGQPLIITSRITRNTRKLVEATAEISLRDGTMLAEGSTVQYVVEAKPHRSPSARQESRDNA